MGFAIQMNRVFWLLAFLWPSIILAEPTASSTDTGAWLLTQCEGFVYTDGITPSNALCVGYVRGVVQYWYQGVVHSNPRGAQFWMAEYGSVSSSEMAKVVLHYLQVNPDALQHQAPSVIIQALTQAYPIPNGPGFSS